MGLIISVKVFQ